MHRSALWIVAASVWCLGCATRAEPSLKADFRILCWPSDGEIFALERFEKSGEGGRRALLSLAKSSDPKDADCGIGGLAMLADTRVVPELASRLRPARQTPQQAQALLDRALELTARVPASDGAALLPLIEAVAPYFDLNPLRAFGTIGQIEHPNARATLRRELTSSTGVRLEGAVFAAALQGDLGVFDEIGKRANHPDLQTATGRQRLAFYYLAADATTVAEGLQRVNRLPAEEQGFPSGWAVQALCWRAIRRPHEAEAINQHRARLKEELLRRRILWMKGMLPGKLVCELGGGSL